MALNTQTSGALGGAAQGAATGFKLSGGNPIGAAVGALAGGLLGGLTGGSDKKAKRLAGLQADLIRRTAQENQRRAELEMGQVLGYGRAAIAAGNLLETGSSRNYMNQLRSQFQQDIEWERVKAQMEEKAARMGGQITAGQIQARGLSSMIGGFQQAAVAFGPIFSSKPKGG
ncbi:hypothetical protein CWI75_10675 [Kineobactrum sediminis]|uniref:Glycine zipper domain-containing protein n=1 Tax=Kineobactrum sediminis TaxID=1905677 RepID=A0A2N5Y1H0_9GAMM|nr:hypothetical protein [Kineobactrum sediminis]PLW82234.1 hypothetical protein CWI75_10675 [Kineobactrum sediminis]